MPRLFVKDELILNKDIFIKDKQFHYLNNVMRCKKGDEVILVNGRDGEFKAKIVVLQNKLITLNVFEKTMEYFQEPFLGFIFAPIKKMDLLIKSAVELGVSSFYPVKTDYTYIKYTDIEANIIEGIEQSERLDFPITNKIDKLENIINSIDGTILFCEERTGINSLSALKDVTFRDKIYCLVGPEGGFSQNEKEILRKHDKVMSVNLGRLILRTETASISILSIARLLCGNVIDK